MKLLLSFYMLVLLSIASVMMYGCNLEQVPIVRPSNPAPQALAGGLAVNASGTIQFYETVQATYYPNFRERVGDTIPHPVLVIIADSAQDTVDINLANVTPDTGSYYVTNTLSPGSTFAYFSAPAYSPPPEGYVAYNYFLVPYGHIIISSFDSTHQLLSGTFSFDQNVGRPMERMYLDGTFNRIPYKIVQ